MSTAKVPVTNSQPSRAALLRAAAAIPSVPQASGVAGVLKQFGLVTIVLQPNTPFPISVEGDYIFLQNSDRPLAQSVGEVDSPFPLLTAKDSNSNVVLIDRPGKGYILPQPFNSIAITYTPGTLPPAAATQTLTVQVYVGYGRVQDDSGLRIAAGLGVASQNLVVTRPNNVTPYAAGQFVADGANFIIQRVTRQPGSSAIITRAKLHKSAINAVNANFSAWLFFALANTNFTNTDQLPFIFNATAAGLVVGRIDFPQFVTGGAGSTHSVCDVAGISIPVSTDATQSTIPGANAFASPGSLYVALVANAAYVPTANEIFTLSLFCDHY